MAVSHNWLQTLPASTCRSPAALSRAGSLTISSGLEWSHVKAARCTSYQQNSSKPFLMLLIPLKTYCTFQQPVVCSEALWILISGAEYLLNVVLASMTSDTLGNKLYITSRTPVTSAARAAKRNSPSRSVCAERVDTRSIAPSPLAQLNANMRSRKAKVTNPRNKGFAPMRLFLPSDVQAVAQRKLNKIEKRRLVCQRRKEREELKLTELQVLLCWPDGTCMLICSTA